MGAVSRFSSQQHKSFLCSFYLTFSSVSLEFKWCKKRVVLARLQLGRRDRNITLSVPSNCKPYIKDNTLFFLLIALINPLVIKYRFYLTNSTTTATNTTKIIITVVIYSIIYFIVRIRTQSFENVNSILTFTLRIHLRVSISSCKQEMSGFSEQAICHAIRL